MDDCCLPTERKRLRALVFCKFYCNTLVYLHKKSPLLSHSPLPCSNYTLLTKPFHLTKPCCRRAELLEGRFIWMCFCFTQNENQNVGEEEGQRKCALCTFTSERRKVKWSQKIIPIKIINNICYSILLLASVAQLSECLNVWLFRRALSSNDNITLMSSAVKLSHDLTNSFKSNNFMAHMIYSTKVLTSSRPHSVVFFIKQCSMITT